MSLRANVVANAVGQAVAAGVAFVLAPLFVRELGLEAWGLIGILAVLSAWFSLMDFGLTPSITRAVAQAVPGQASARQAAGLVRAVEVIYAGAALFVAAAVALGADLVVAHWLRLGALSPQAASTAIAWMGLIVAVRLFENVYRAVLSGLQQLVTLNLLSSLAAVVRWAGGLAVVVAFDVGIEGLFAWQCGVAAVSLATFAWIARRRLRVLGTQRDAALAALGQIKGFATGIAFTSILAFLLTQLDKLLLSKLLPLADFGLYVLASSLADALALLAAPFYGALLPRFVQLMGRGDDAAVADLYLRTSRLLAAMLAPFAFLLVVFGDAVVLAWTGSAALAPQIAPLLAVLAFGRMLNGFMQLPAALQVAAGWTSLGVALNLAAVVILVPLVLATVPGNGAIAYAWCWVGLNVGYLVVGTSWMHRRLLPAARDPWLWQSVLRPAGVALACMLAARAAFELPAGRVALAAGLAVLLAAVLGVTLVAARAHRDLLRPRA